MSVTCAEESIKISTKWYQLPQTLNSPFTDMPKITFMGYNRAVVKNMQNWLFKGLVGLIQNGKGNSC